MNNAYEINGNWYLVLIINIIIKGYLREWVKEEEFGVTQGELFYFNTNNLCGGVIPQGKESSSSKSELSTHTIQQKQRTSIKITFHKSNL